MGKVIYIEKFNNIGGMDMTNNDIEKLAMNILDSNGFNTVVVDPVKLANSYGIEVKNARFSDGDISGLSLIHIYHKPFYHIHLVARKKIQKLIYFPLAF